MMMRLATALVAALLSTLVAPSHAAWGERDCSFGTGGSMALPAFGSPFTAVPEASGNVLVRYGFVSTSTSLARITPDGTLVGDVGGTAGGVLDDVAEVVLASGNILFVTGQGLPFLSVPAGLVRLLPTGVRDDTFGTGGYATLAGLTTVSAGPIVQPDGRILVGGANSSGSAAIARFNADGTPDMTFGTGGIAANTATGTTRYRSIALQPDGRILGLSFGGITRHLATGEIDASFGSAGTVSTAIFQSLLVRVQASGNILFVGKFTAFSYQPLQLALYDSTGSVITSKMATTSLLPTGSNQIGLAYSPAAPLHVMPDGRLVITGASPDGTGVITRYTADLNEEVGALLDVKPTVSHVLPTGKVLVGTFTTHEMRRLLGDSDAATCTPTTTVMTSNPNPSIFGQPVTLTATVSASAGAPAGTVQFKQNNSIAGLPVGLVNGVAQVTTTGLAPGSLQLTATYLPAGSFAGSVSPPLTQFVDAALSINDATTALSATPTTMLFNVTLAGETSGATVTVDFATSNHTAMAGVDYTAASGTLSFSPGDKTKQIAVPIAARLPGPNKDFFLTLSNPAHAGLAKGAGIGTIVYADSGTLSIYVDDPAVLEGHSGITLMGFAVSLSKPNATNVTVGYATADGTAAAGTDYNAQSGTLTFHPGQTQQWVVVPVIGNLTDEPNRQFFLNLSNASTGAIVKSQGIGTIVDDDPVSAAATVPMYRLYSNITKEHLYTTDANEYAVLATRNWVQEGTAYTMFGDSGSYGTQYVTPLYRMYHPGVLQHHWTTDSYEVMVLASQGAWQYEGIPGYVLPSADTGTTPLYRLMYFSPPLHLWTTDAYEKDVLSTQYGWVYEGIVGEVLP